MSEANLENKETLLPENFPFREELAVSEVKTVEALQKLSLDEIIAFPKIGKKKAAEISKALTVLTTPKSEAEINQEKRRKFEEEQRVHYALRMEAEKAQYLPETPKQANK
jgi:DNA repair protein RadC